MRALLRIAGAVALLFWRTLKSIQREGLSLRETLRQTYSLGASSALLVTMGMIFFGVVMTGLAYTQARKYVGNVSILGPAYFELIVREFAPMMTALLAASRSAAATSAELGAMSVNEQVEALELSAADPVAELVAPRLVASVLSMPALTVIGIASASISAALSITYLYHADGWSFLDPRFLEPADVVCGFVKSILCGAFIPLVGSVRGLEARGGAAAVGDAVTLGVVGACMGCLVIDFMVAATFLMVGL